MIKVGIVGYGNLGSSIEALLDNTPDMKLVAIFTSRNLNEVEIKSDVNLVRIDDVLAYKDEVDVLFLCGGSASNMRELGPRLSKYFNTVDSYDNHKKISEYYELMNKSSLEGNKVSLVSTGWDPGLFSINRLFAESVLPNGKTYTFWGPGISQGHGEAIRKIEGVYDAVQYTVPTEGVICEIRNGSMKDYTTKEKHKRICFVVACHGADRKKIEESIKMMPDYFIDYDTTVNFISEKELNENHRAMPHGGFVLRRGEALGNAEMIEYGLTLESNPLFTAGVMIAYGRACHKFYENNDFGAKTVFDVAPSMLSLKDGKTLVREML